MMKSGAKKGEFGAVIQRPQFESLCGMFCTSQEICSFFGVSFNTLQRWCKQEYGITFGEIYQQKSDMGKISLRRTQMRLADRSVPMAIFLGKQYLGQTDEVEAHIDAVEITNDVPEQ